jgi:predicted nucleic acid-binding protein
VTVVVQPAPVVVDASVVVALVREEEPAIERAWHGWFEAGSEVFAPTFLWLELANALLRGRRLPAAVVATLLEELEASGIETADRGPAGVRASLDLAERHELTVYDAAYLWLAIDLDAELATTDAALVRAARAEEVALAL